MPDDPFTPAARKAWEAIPSAHRETLLGNVWCVRCSDETTLVRYSGRVERGLLVLTGKCARCGHEAARAVEGS